MTGAALADGSSSFHREIFRKMVGNQLKNQLQAAGISGIRNSCSSLTVLRDQDGEKTEERAFDGQFVSGRLQTIGFFGPVSYTHLAWRMALTALRTPEN